MRTVLAASWQACRSFGGVGETKRVLSGKGDPRFIFSQRSPDRFVATRLSMVIRSQDLILGPGKVQGQPCQFSIEGMEVGIGHPGGKGNQPMTQMFSPKPLLALCPDSITGGDFLEGQEIHELEFVADVIRDFSRFTSLRQACFTECIDDISTHLTHESALGFEVHRGIGWRLDLERAKEELGIGQLQGSRSPRAVDHAIAVASANALSSPPNGRNCSSSDAGSSTCHCAGWRRARARTW